MVMIWIDGVLLSLSLIPKESGQEESMHKQTKHSGHSGETCMHAHGSPRPGPFFVFLLLIACFPYTLFKAYACIVSNFERHTQVVNVLISKFLDFMSMVEQLA
jgi:hypothetical protein